VRVVTVPPGWLREVESYYGVQILPADFALVEEPGIDEVLVSGARVCFTGTVYSPRHGTVERSEMKALAVRCGLEPVDSATKKKTDALVVAERGTQSTKAKNAAKWDKPVFAAEEFLDWAEGSSS
jgi:ATP-dependent DNA helicase PIF1